MKGPHSLNHALQPALFNCTHSMEDITACVICGRRLKPERKHVDTCGKTCFSTLLKMQRSLHLRGEIRA